MAFAVEAQNTGIDSLKKVLRNTKVDSTKINSYIALAKEYTESGAVSVYSLAKAM